MELFLTNFLAALPLFALIAIGYLAATVKLVTPAIGQALSKFAFNIALPILLFRLMSDITHLPPPDWNIALAFFGSCFLVFAIGRFLGHRFLNLNSDERTIFGMATVFSNNVQLGIPVAVALLGQEAMPSIAIIFSLNGFLMWTLVTTVTKGTLQTIRNPIVIGIILGFFWSISNLSMPAPMAKTIGMMADAAAPVALFAVGVGLTQYRITANLSTTLLITFLKLGLQPLVVYGLCRIFNLGHEAMQATCLLACLPVGVNVYIMAQEFKVMQGATANSLLVTTALAAVTMPLIMSCFGLL
ncbi:AEC family transporter [uncultured Sutterella sp.]|uniref:AEC family transporter n=1 Tax=uncultured Sutterella sp. TaxID=286133 RepID=UPI0025E93155|nr:AEC family transporter [uncultured Sutterella sp.]